MIVSSVPYKRHKSANLRKHVWRIRSQNSTMYKKVLRNLITFFSLLKFLEFCLQNFQPAVQCVADK